MNSKKLKVYNLGWNKQTNKYLVHPPTMKPYKALSFVSDV